MGKWIGNLAIAPLLSDNFRDALRFAVTALVEGRYSDLNLSSELLPEELADALSLYPGKLVAIPKHGYDYVNLGVRNDASGGGWWVDIDLWTDKEGRSDLTAQFVASRVGEGFRFELKNVHVL